MSSTEKCPALTLVPALIQKEKAPASAYSESAGNEEPGPLRAPGSRQAASPAVLERANTQRISLPGDPRQKAIRSAAHLIAAETTTGRTAESQFACGRL
jgi:hypothetical protein